MSKPELFSGDLSGELRRMYTVKNVRGDVIGTTVIQYPRRVYYNAVGAYHRVLDSRGVVTLCPAPGPVVKNNKIVGYCEVSWMPMDRANPVQW